MQYAVVTLLAFASSAAAQLATTSEPAASVIQAAQATVVPTSPTSNVKGAAFSRFIQIWLENIDYSSAAGNGDQKWLASQGIQLNNYFGVSHPSEPNYCASAAGDTFGMDNDNWQQIPSNISTVADLLDTKAISYGEYQEAIPYAGFQGFNYSNQQTFANDYVRKHNPLILFNNFASNNTRTTTVKNFTSFYNDITNQQLPQWSFITPNMTNDGHDTNVSFAGSWERTFITALMNNTYFWNDTLILLTWDESERYPIENRVFSVLLGGAVPASAVGTQDNTFYTHYSSIASVEANWGLPSLGRWDCGANIFEVVANKTGTTNWNVDLTNVYLNQTSNGPLSTNTYSNFTSVWPVPLTDSSIKCSAGHGILQSVIDTWGNETATLNYTSPVPYDTRKNLNTPTTITRNGTTYVLGHNATSNTSPSSSSSSGSSTSSSSPAAKSSSAAGSIEATNAVTFLGALFAIAAAF